MENKLTEVKDILIKNKKTISTMESCTGGAFANAITDIEGASNIIKFSAVTYSNEFKIKMGVPKDIIDSYTVYSIQTAKAMAKAISDFTNSDYSIGITGKLNKIDLNNPSGSDNEVFISVYDKKIDKYYDKNIYVTKQNRKLNKEEVINITLDILLDTLKKL